MLKKLSLTLFAVVSIISIGVAQQWFPYPIVGGSSFCSSSVNAVCVNTVPAGPALTGSETIPADTNASGGQSPQTVKLSLQNLGVGPYQYVAAVNGQVIPQNPLARRLILEPSGTIAALTVLLDPATMLVDNQTFGICTTQIVTALTMTAGSGTILSGGVTALSVPSTTGAASCPEWVYRQTNTTWYRIH